MNTVVSLFSGGGGLDLGFIQEGFEIIWAIDNDKNAVETYKKNIGGHIVCQDINSIDPCRIPAADIVIGGPPCQAFSLAGARRADDARGRLVWKYIDIISALRPRAFVFENVTGLQSVKNQDGNKMLPMLVDAFKSIGYGVSLKVMNAADYGVPQRRKRVIIVGLKECADFTFPGPTHSADGGDGLKKHVSVEAALGDLPAAVQDGQEIIAYRHPPKNEYQRAMQSRGGITDHVVPQMSRLDRYIIAHVKPGGNYMDIPADVDSARIRRLQRDGGHTTCYGRLDPSKPAYTINTYFNRPNVGCNIHYSQDRLITVREALRLQSFPDSYQIVSGNKQGKNLIVGNAVPPGLARVIAHRLREHLGEI